jgi:hypothetical protein
MTPPRHVLNVGLGLFLLVALTEHGTAGNGDAWIAKIRKDHPRPFRGVFPDRPASRPALRTAVRPADRGKHWCFPWEKHPGPK